MIGTGAPPTDPAACDFLSLRRAHVANPALEAVARADPELAARLADSIEACLDGARASSTMRSYQATVN